MGRAISPAPGAPKPVQRGTVSLVYGSNDVTISPVNIDKTRINIIGPGISASGGTVNWYAALINSTTLRFNSAIGGGYNLAVSYEVLETY